MIYLGCHLTSAKGFENMAKEAISINADTLQFFTRNPRGGKAKAIDENDAARYRSLAAKHNFGKVVAHAPYTLNPCSKDSKVREFAHMAMSDDLLRMEYVPRQLLQLSSRKPCGTGYRKRHRAHKRPAQSDTPA